MLRSRLLAMALILGVVSFLPGARAVPAQAATGAGACASHLVPATGFADTVRSPHRAAIDCASWWGLVQGRTVTNFSPSADVTRGQTAAMVARLLRATGHAPQEVTTTGFDDTTNHLFELDIDLLSSLGIISGVSANRYAPDLPVTRAQMATIVARTFALAYDSPLPSATTTFSDIGPGDIHHDAVARLVAAGITTGTTATTFEPKRAVPREQLASFLTRAATVLLDGGLAQLPTARPAADDAYASRLRGAWVHLFDDALKSRSGIRQLVGELAAADVNMVIAQVARRHDAYYTSDVLPRTPDPALAADLDVLAELITAAHAEGIEVHAWFGVGPTWHDVYEDLPAPTGWIHTEHGTAAPERQRWVSRTYDGTWSTYLDPGVRETQEHVAAVVGELADRYPVDGIHLDYVRYESANHGYNPRALARYREETGASGTPPPGDPGWTQWRREQTRQTILAARDAIQRSGRDIPLSAAVTTWGAGPSTQDRAGFRRTMPYTRTLQDWDGWVRRGEVDMVMPMNYFRAGDSEQARWFARWVAYERALAAGTDVQVVPGVGAYLNRPADVLAQSRAAMAADGAVIYSYQQPTADGSRAVWRQLAGTRWGYAPNR